MNNVNYFTLASVRSENAKAFDAAIKNAFAQAAADVGAEVIIQAFCQLDKADLKALKAA